MEEGEQRHEPSTAPAAEDASAAPAEGGYSFFQMFFVPMLIAGVLTGVILFFGLIGNDDKDVRTHLQEIRMGSEHQRWQSAFQLADRLQRLPPGETVGPEERRLALQIFEEAEGRDPKIRPYLALALGQMGAKEAVPALTRALSEPPPAPPFDAADTRIYALMALGAIGDPQSAQAVIALLSSDDAGLRKTAAFALGGIGGDAAREGLGKTLHDPVPDVAWNSALSLARLGDAGGKDLLLTMADRATVAKTPGMTERQVADVLEGAARALGSLRVREAEATLQNLSSKDPDHRVRKAAGTALEHIAKGR